MEVDVPLNGTQVSMEQVKADEASWRIIWAMDRDTGFYHIVYDGQDNDDGKTVFDHIHDHWVKGDDVSNIADWHGPRSERAEALKLHT